jgi:hypothetical protein
MQTPNQDQSQSKTPLPDHEKQSNPNTEAFVRLLARLVANRWRKITQENSIEEAPSSEAAVSVK